MRTATAPVESASPVTVPMGSRPVGPCDLLTSWTTCAEPARKAARHRHRRRAGTVGPPGRVAHSIRAWHRRARHVSTEFRSGSNWPGTPHHRRSPNNGSTFYRQTGTYRFSTPNGQRFHPSRRVVRMSRRTLNSAAPVIHAGILLHPPPLPPHKGLLTIPRRLAVRGFSASGHVHQCRQQRPIRVSHLAESHHVTGGERASRCRHPRGRDPRDRAPGRPTEVGAGPASRPSSCSRRPPPRRSTSRSDGARRQCP